MKVLSNRVSPSKETKEECDNVSKLVYVKVQFLSERNESGSLTTPFMKSSSVMQVGDTKT